MSHQPRITIVKEESEKSAGTGRINLHAANESEILREVHAADLRYIDDLNAAMLAKTPYQTRRLLYLICGIVLVLIVWGNFAQVDEVTIGTGKVIPSKHIQVIQNLEGGIVKSINVKEGQIVQKDEKLLVIDNTQFLSDFREQKQKQTSIKAWIRRLETELDTVYISSTDGRSLIHIEQKTLDFPNLDPIDDADLILRQQDYYNERIGNVINQLEILDQQVSQRKSALDELTSKISYLEESYSLVMKEVKITKPLARKGVVSEVELIKLERTANEVKSELASAQAIKPKLKSEILETTNKREEIVLNFRNDTQKQLQELQDMLDGLEENLISLEDRLRRTDVLSPVHGTIKTINITTVGGVVQPGMDIMEIVPVEDSLLVEVQILPKDIAFLRPGLEAVIKLTAYDFAIYGGLDGIVEHISADTIQDDKGNSFYLIRVRTDDTYTDASGNPLPIIPGMTASVDVITGKKSIMDYLLKPIVRAKQNALREK